MIGIFAKDSESATARELFELFKIPWKFYKAGDICDLVISTREETSTAIQANKVVIFSSGPVDIDEQRGILIESTPCDTVVCDRLEIPIHGRTCMVRGAGEPILRCKQSTRPVGIQLSTETGGCIRVGYDLFSEVQVLLSDGQPLVQARIPSLERHIALLRALILKVQVPVIEIPPSPFGYDFAACLSHDVDFVGIKDHNFDRTMWGFLYRALIVSLLGALKGSYSWRKCVQNWKAALSLPLVHLGLADDFWVEFERYQQIEKDLGSTFFFIPFKEVPGERGDAPAPKLRAAKYDFAELGEDVRDLRENGCEIGLHGIDAWWSREKAQAEAARIREIRGDGEIGTRMHWLYWSQTSPQILEEAGFEYDSTFGYNDQVGFRAGTTQPFRPAGVSRLLELPLNIQDTALFYPDRMNLSEGEALTACKQLMEECASFGGVLTINWHTRSLSPERQWSDFYQTLLAELRKYRVWFGTAHQIIKWFRMRRELKFEDVRFSGERVQIKISGPPPDQVLPFAVRIFSPKAVSQTTDSGVSTSSVTTLLWQGEEQLETALA